TQWPKNTVNAAASQHSVSHKTLLVTTPIASPGYVSSRMIYVMIPYQLRSFSNHAWIAPPADLLLPLIANRLRANHYFKAVVTTPFSGAANIELNTQLLTLQQEFLQPQSVVRLTMEATLLDTASGHVIASHVFTAVVSAPGNNPYSGVLATNQAAHNVVSQIAKFVVNSVG
ncbi:MAG: ABC-type transport auxiliary lipoprotein family protein, partial [Gammaproteobacteria bacterium]|nr:ABC-type transport auxiliary lipoprotein family protein [Gammaproteobacteria bacterium]